MNAQKLRALLDDLENQGYDLEKIEFLVATQPVYPMEMVIKDFVFDEDTERFYIAAPGNTNYLRRNVWEELGW